MSSVASTRLLKPLLKLVAAGVVAIMLFILVLNAIKNPVEGKTSGYSADFTDVSGLRKNADVRIRGVKVGNVEQITIKQDGGRNVAEVEFTIAAPERVTDGSTLAVKYANLSGVRYIDIEQPDADGPVMRHAPVSKTIPSFDVTDLFNGLQPVLETLSPQEVNEFSQNAVTMLQGDGSGLGPMLDSVEKLSAYVSDREEVISVLVTNLSRISETMGGKSPEIIEFLRYLEAPIDSALGVLDQFQKADAYGPAFMGAVDQLLIGLGIDRDLDVDKLLATAVPDVDLMAQTLQRLPTFLAGLQSSVGSGDGGDLQCSKGQAVLPDLAKVLVNGSEVVVCNAS